MTPKFAVGDIVVVVKPITESSIHTDELGWIGVIEEIRPKPSRYKFLVRFKHMPNSFSYSEQNLELNEIYNSKLNKALR